jgi:PilZ domain
MPATKRSRKLNHDRRSHRRYPVSVDIKYSLAVPSGHVQVGRGRTINLSSGGVLFEAEVAIPVNASIELSISWPGLSDPQIQLELHATGKALRVGDSKVAVKFDRSIFGTARHASDGKINGDVR